VGFRVQRVGSVPDAGLSWTVLGPDLLPVPHIEEFLVYLTDLGRSPETVRAYAHGLRQFEQFLALRDRCWDAVALKDFGAFVGWLRRPDPDVIVMPGLPSARSEATIRLRLAAVMALYQFHARNGVVVAEQLVREYRRGGPAFVPFLAHLQGGRAREVAVRFRAVRRLPRELSRAEVQSILEACHRLRDRFFFALLYATGMRVGQALGLRHEDVRSWDNEIAIVPRVDNANGARSKTLHKEYVVAVETDLMRLFGDYMHAEYGDLDSDYVFVNLWEEPVGRAWRYSSVVDVVRRLRQRVGFDFTAHMFRHTHATELLRHGVPLEVVRARLGHASIQTTNDIYGHLTTNDQRKELAPYFATLSLPGSAG
jgi:integrase/recombinase XerD